MIRPAQSTRHNTFTFPHIISLIFRVSTHFFSDIATQAYIHARYLGLGDSSIPRYPLFQCSHTLLIMGDSVVALSRELVCSQPSPFILFMNNCSHIPSSHGGHGPRGVKGLIIYNNCQKTEILGVNYFAIPFAILVQ